MILLSAIRSKSQSRSYLYLCRCLCFHCILCLCHRSNLVCCLEAFLASLLSYTVSHATRPFIKSFSSTPRSCSVRSSLTCSFASFVPVPRERTHVVVPMDLGNVGTHDARTTQSDQDANNDMSYWSVDGHHFLVDDLHFYHNFVEFPWSRQELSLDVLRHHFPHHTSSALHRGARTQPLSMTVP